MCPEYTQTDRQTHKDDAKTITLITAETWGVINEVEFEKHPQVTELKLKMQLMPFSISTQLPGYVLNKMSLIFLIHCILASCISGLLKTYVKMVIISPSG